MPADTTVPALTARDAQLAANGMRRTADKLRAKAAFWSAGATRERILDRAEQADAVADALEVEHFRT